ncbi:MAG: SnoaL-like domain-containing protein [Chitinophagaceae bacterium]
MTTQEIAERLVDYCRKGQFEQAQKELYADDAVSVEPDETSGFPKETVGLNNIIEKGNQFQSMVDEMHGCTVGEPIVASNAIAFTLSMDMSMKGRGRSMMEEICTYRIKNGKIIGEYFYY